MDPRSNEAPIQLPVPAEQVNELGTSDRGTESTAGLAPSFTSVAQPAARPVNIPLPATPSMPQATQAVASMNTDGNNPSQASDDTDLIEKEWVNKAKAIVEQTKDDPYKQSEELTIFKSDYMKKRYNRTIKLSK